MADWNSRQYLMFENERTQPAIDLVNRICMSSPGKIIDIGCGPGNSTQVLAQRFPGAYILGVDNSANMIEAAQKTYPNLHFEIVDAGKDLKQLDRDFDIVFSNACIQWIPDHYTLLRNMLGLLKKGGILAVQIPVNFHEPIHRIILEVSQDDKWKSCFNIPRSFYNLTQSDYYDLFSEIAQEFSMWETIYCHKMNSHQDIMQWYRSTGLRPYLDALSDDKKPEFEKDILYRVVQEYPLQKNGSIIFRFPRFFFIAKV